MEVIGKGKTAEVLACDETKVCKLFFEGYPEGAVKREYENALLLNQLGLPVPQIYGLEKIEARTGIIYERLYGETMLERILRGEEINPLFELFCDLHTKMGRVHTNKVQSYKEFILSCMGEKTEFHSKVCLMLDELPDGDSLCHGDFHPDNAWMNLDGSVLAIDFMNLCRGPWEYDVARSYILISEGELPAGMPNRDEMIAGQKMLADMYLEKIGIAMDEIKQYFPLIRFCKENSI